STSSSAASSSRPTRPSSKTCRSSRSSASIRATRPPMRPGGVLPRRPSTMRRCAISSCICTACSIRLLNHCRLPPRPPAMLERAVHDRPTAMPPAQLNDLRILRRLARDYLGRRKGALAVAVVCMVVAATMNGLIAWLLGPVVKQIFELKNLQMIIGLPLAVIAIVVVRALATFWQETTLTGLAERVVSDVQRDMLASQIRLDIAAFSDVHSGELVSKFLY